SAALPLQQAAFTLDGIPVQIRSPFLPAPTFATPAPDNAVQVATSEAGQPYREFGVTAVVFGRKPGTEALPVAQAGGATVYRTALHDVRVAQAGQPQPGPIATLFGQAVPSEVSLVPLPLDSTTLKPTLIVEWVVEAQGRLWIVRVSQEQPAGTTGVPAHTPWLDALGALIVQ
ncbi:MAG: hypothetical protein M3Z04_17670, partial [Chloroflexota bacterium]|nr:hypothetical protein [Chloroflexota bacterium]